MLSTCSLPTWRNQDAGSRRAPTCEWLASLRPSARRFCLSRSSARSSTAMAVMQGKSHGRCFQESSVHPPIPFPAAKRGRPTPGIGVWSGVLLVGTHSGRLPEARLTHLGGGGRKATLFLPFLTATFDFSFLQRYSHPSTSDEGSAEPELYLSQSLQTGREQTTEMTPWVRAPLHLLRPETAQTAQS